MNSDCLSVTQSMTSVNLELMDKDRECQFCGTPNPNDNFHCVSCDKRVSPPKFTTNMWMRSEIGTRTDIELNERTMEDSINRMYRQSRNFDKFDEMRGV